MSGPYRTIVVDPPWAYPEGIGVPHGNPHKQDRERGMPTSGKTKRQTLPYGAMSVSEIANVPVWELTASDARLFLWTTNRWLPDAFYVLERWGFSYRQLVVWDKSPNFSPFPGSVAPNAAEYLVVASRGSPEILSCARPKAPLNP
jgi:N6-adenosine-specific RNA methylase IME4